jgi:hypothetical protein
MKIEQTLWTTTDGWRTLPSSDVLDKADIVIFFCGSRLEHLPERYAELTKCYPQAQILGCTSAGEILDGEVLDNSLVATAVEFSSTQLAVASYHISTMEESFQAGKTLAEGLPLDGLRLVFIISDGQHVNGSELVRGVASVVGDAIPITGGLAGDGAYFQRTAVSVNCPPESHCIGIVGLYGDALLVGHGSVGGWNPFGPERRITKAHKNILYEIDGSPALALYKKYLGDEAKNLPGSALLFPLTIRPADNSRPPVVRTVLSIEEHTQSMTFAGDVPEGSISQLMMANFDRLVEGAAQAASSAASTLLSRDNTHRSLALLISCVGRKLVLGQRTSDEVEAVREIVGEQAAIVGFYSYGEICPNGTFQTCELHNQTMTITTIAEH